MKRLRPQLWKSVAVTVLAGLAATAIQAEVYQWKDANGNTVFGDSPPESVRAAAVDLPLLTIADSYGSDRNKNDDKQSVVANPEAEAEASATDDNAQPVVYKRFKVASPQKDEGVRANNGNVMVRFDLEPALQPGHGLVVYLDGKQVANDSATVFSLENLDRGEHSVFAVLHGLNNEVIKNTQPVKFHVLRASVKR